MVNWDEAGKKWPQPHPHAARLLRGLLWGQQYRHSNPQCEGGMPGSFELREDMDEDDNMDFGITKKRPSSDPPR